jgi:hypothetical protein
VTGFFHGVIQLSLMNCLSRLAEQTAGIRAIKLFLGEFVMLIGMPREGFLLQMTVSQGHTRVNLSWTRPGTIRNDQKKN